MSARRVAVAVVVVAGAVLGFSPLYAERKPRHPSPEAGAEREVTELLEREAASPLDRRTSLHPLLNRLPDLIAARWQSGYTSTEKSWRSYDAPLDTEQAALLAEYRDRRSGAPETVRAKLALAKWCDANALRDEARALRTVALFLANPAEQPHILKSLGYRQAGNEWVGPRELEDATRSAREAEYSSKIWGPRIERIARQLQASTHQRIAARAALLDIADPAAIPAMEIHLAPQEPALLVEKLATMPAYEASLSLARLAVFTNAVEVRKSSTRALGERRKEDYVPSLIQLLSTPVQSKITVARVPKGWIFESVLTTETSNRLQVWRSSKAYLPVMSVATIGVQTGRVSGAMVGDLDTSPSPDGGTFSTDISRLIGDDVHRAARTATIQKDSIEELNGRVAAVLAGVSGREPSTDPTAWWGWWAAYSGVDQAGTGTKIVDEFSDEQVYRPMIQALHLSPSCFQAGTPVWTESGMQPVEEIRVGDRVLAQDVETGELTYKPVLQTSVRAPRQLVQLTANGETLTCTDGHRFWVAGEAWIKARDLTPKHLLHTARGTIRVESVTEADVDRTYNLVVADFHSYFVGKQAMLVQDLPLPRSTNCVVPGLQPEW